MSKSLGLGISSRLKSRGVLHCLDDSGLPQVGVVPVVWSVNTGLKPTLLRLSSTSVRNRFVVLNEKAYLGTDLLDTVVGFRSQRSDSSNHLLY